MRIGYVRAGKGPGRSVAEQRDTLAAHKCTRIYSDADAGSIDNIVRTLRRGDYLCVSSADRIADTPAEMFRLVREVHARGAVVHDVATGTTSTSIDFAEAHRDGMMQERYGLTPEEARRRGAMGGKKRLKLPLTKKAALEIWRDPLLRPEAAAEKIGASMAYCYRWLGKRGTPAGRPKLSKKR